MPKSKRGARDVFHFFLALIVEWWFHIPRDPLTLCFFYFGLFLGIEKSDEINAGHPRHHQHTYLPHVNIEFNCLDTHKKKH